MIGSLGRNRFRQGQADPSPIGAPAGSDQGVSAAQLQDERGGDHTALALRREHHDVVVVGGEMADAPEQLRDDALGVTGRSERVGGPRPEGAEVPEDRSATPSGWRLILTHESSKAE